MQSVYEAAGGDAGLVRLAVKEITTWGVVVGLLLGFATDALLTAGGA